MVFFRAYLFVMLITLNTWCIANNKLVLVLFLSFCISLTWTFNVNSVSNSPFRIKIYYSLGSVCGTATALYLSAFL